MLLLKHILYNLVLVLLCFNVQGQIKLLDEFNLDQVTGAIIPSLNEGIITTLYSRQQEQDTSYTSIIQLNTRLEVQNEIVLPFSEFPFAAIYIIDVYDEESYILLLATDKSSKPEDRLNRKLLLMILSKDF